MAHITSARGLIGAAHYPAKIIAAADEVRPAARLRVGFDAKVAGCGRLRCRRAVAASSSSRSFTVSASVAAAEKSSALPEIVLQPIKEISGLVKLPGSKSLSNRILLLAALAEVRFLSALFVDPFMFACMKVWVFKYLDWIRMSCC